MKAYFGAPVRGASGESATIEEINANIALALQIACWLRVKFPQVDWTIPHEHEEIIQELYNDGVPARQIIRCWARIAARCDFGVFFDGGQFSRGMEFEEDYMTRAGKPTIYIDEAGDEAENDIQMIIASLMAAPQESEVENVP